MTAERWRQLMDVMQAAWGMDVADRPAFLDQIGAQDPKVGSNLEALLASDQNIGEFLSQPLAGAVAGLRDYGGSLSGEADAPTRGAEFIAGWRIGPYKVLREIGRGGMGTVHLAERADGLYQKRVAIKLIKADFGGADMQRRFRNERQVVATLDHPNIARLLHGGVTEEGLPYLVMEYVEGERIDYWCDNRKLPLRDRLKVFRNVCAAVQHAHDNQVIHRDLKPGNILVTAEGIPKLLDFGIAKVLNPDLSSQTTETTIGPAPMTPEYASPEQVRGERVGPASDIYALDILLYHLLTGRLPYSLQGRNLRQIAGVICEQEPLKPSRVISNPSQKVVAQDKGGVAATPESVSAARGETPRDLCRHLEGDLDTIVLKALRKEPERRYTSVAQLSTDLDRFLQDRPVQARKETLRYRARKFLKRNRSLVTAVALTAVLVLSLFAELYHLRRFHGGSNGAVRSIAVLPFSDMSSEKNQAYLCDGVTEELLNALRSIPGFRVAGRESSFQFRDKTVGYRIIGQKPHVDAILEGKVRKQGSRVRIATELIRVADGLRLWSQDFDREMNDIAAVPDEIAHAVTSELKIELVRAPSLSSKSKNVEAYKAYLLGHYLGDRLDKESVQKAVSYFEQAIELEPGYAQAWVGLGVSRTAQASLGYLLPPEEGWRNARKALDHALTLDADLAEAYVALASIQFRHDLDWAGADASFHRALELDPHNTQAIKGAGILAARLGRLDEAIALQRQVIDADPLDHLAYLNVGTALYYAGRLPEAKSALEKVLELAPALPNAHALLGRIYLAESNPQEALAEILKEKGPAFRLFGLALAYHTLGMKHDSDAQLAEFIAEFHESALYQIAEVYAFRGETDHAFGWLERAFSQRDPGLSAIKIDVMMKSLKSDLRYAALLKRMRLPT